VAVVIDTVSEARTSQLLAALGDTVIATYRTLA